MREWTRGELQAFGAVAKLLLIVGVLIAVVSGAFEEYLGLALGVLISIAGLVLGIYLFRYGRKTGKSATPFKR